MELVTQAELSRIAKVSRMSITNAVKTNRLRKIKGSGKINLSDPLTKSYIESSLQKSVTLPKSKQLNRKPDNNSSSSPDLEISPDNPGAFSSIDCCAWSVSTICRFI